MTFYDRVTYILVSQNILTLQNKHLFKNIYCESSTGDTLVNKVLALLELMV